MVDPRPEAAERNVSNSDLAGRDFADPDFTVTLLTPPGRGAVATLSVTGADVAELVAQLFLPASGKSLPAAALGRIVYGRWQTSGEDVIVCRVDERRVEVHCHGGRVAAAEIVRSLVAIGASEQCWQDWVARQERDPIAAAARIELASAGAERAAAVLLDQYHGALRRSVDAILENLDRGAAAAALAEIERLIARAPLGAHLTTPWTVMLAGRPNVGKSSLLNAMLGYERAIVFDAPGTTRDVLRGATALAGWPFEFWDAAGLRETRDRLEAAGVAKAQQRSAEADLVVVVFDVQTAWTQSDEDLLAAMPNALCVVNKCDLASAATMSDSSPSVASGRGTKMPCVPPSALRVSARTGAGLDALRQAIVSRLIRDQLIPIPDEPSTEQSTESAPAAAVPFTSAQRHDLASAAALVVGEQLAAAATLLRCGAAWKLG